MLFKSKLIKFSFQNKGLNLYRLSKKLNFDQYKERSKRHFVLIYRYIEDINYKRSKKFILKNKIFNKKL
jgi:hypothetical protein